MRVKIEFEEENAFTAEEISDTLKAMYGNNSKVQVLPKNDSPESHIYFGVQNLITLDQLEAFYEFYPHLYQEKLSIIKNDTMAKLEGIVNKVIEDIEKRVLE